MFSIEQFIFLFFTMLSHIGASLFFAKPRFGKAATATIWLLYGVMFLILPSSRPALSFFISFAVHMVLFFVTTSGSLHEKGFLFLSYACIYTCANTIFTLLNARTQNLPIKIALAFVIMVLMQVLLYKVLLPSFRKVTPYVHTGWEKFYAVLIGFFALIVSQTLFPIISPMTAKEIAVFLMTMMVFCITYISVFNSMKNIVELTREKQKHTHAELLLAQVESQAKEAELVRQNRHDMRHHYQMLLSYAENGELDKITDYLERQTERIEAITSGRFCENETVNNILKVYHQKAADQNIDIEIRAAAKPELSATAPDLVSITANILENALNGVSESGVQSPFIRVNIKHQAQRFVIICENTCSPSLDFDEIPDWLRGIGTHSIADTANKYNGSCLFSAKDGVFRCMVVMDE